MKLSWRERNAKKNMIRINRTLVSRILKRPTADCFAGKPKKTVTKKRIYIKFEHANVGISNEDDLDDISTWVHEFTEHVVGRLILELMVEEGLTLERMTDIISDGIFIKNIYGGWYNPTAKHIITALCTSSYVDGVKTTPEEYARLFGFKDGPVAQLDSAAPFEGVRCRFEFGRGLLESSCYLKYENDCFTAGLADWDEKEFKDKKLNKGRVA